MALNTHACWYRSYLKCSHGLLKKTPAFGVTHVAVNAAMGLFKKPAFGGTVAAEYAAKTHPQFVAQTLQHPLLKMQPMLGSKNAAGNAVALFKKH